MNEGNHEVRAARGFQAVRTNGLAPYPGEDEDWWKNRVSTLQALATLDPKGNPTARLAVVDKAQVARRTTEGFDRERDKMIAVCSQCHSENFVKNELGKGDAIIRCGDELLAEAI